MDQGVIVKKGQTPGPTEAKYFSKITPEEIQSNEIRALSWKQPFAELMLHGKIETRVWDTKYRGLVLICSSKVGFYTDELRRISGVNQMIRMLDIPIAESALDVFGKAIAIGRLVDSRPMLDTDQDKCFVKYNSNLFCHVYENVIPIVPFDWKGSQGWKKLTLDEKLKIQFF